SPATHPAPPASPEGEHRYLTILFADIRGSTELLAGRDLDEARQILDGVIERLMAAAHEAGGTVNQVMGDGIMAMVGAPVARPDRDHRGNPGPDRGPGRRAVARPCGGEGANRGRGGLRGAWLARNHRNQAV